MHDDGDDECTRVGDFPGFTSDRDDDPFKMTTLKYLPA